MKFVTVEVDFRIVQGKASRPTIGHVARMLTLYCAARAKQPPVLSVGVIHFSEKVGQPERVSKD